MRVVLDGVAHYKCDFCRRDFSAEKAPHLSFEAGERSGFVSPHDNPLPGWRFKYELRPGRYNFCPPEEGQCLQLWFAVFVSGPIPEMVR